MEPISKAQEWVTQDPDPETRSELQALLDRGDTTRIAELFAGNLEFGTAGLRAELGSGPLRMNRVVVSRTAAGLAHFLNNQSEQPRIVIGYDARHNSAQFARDTAEIMAGAGIESLLLPEPLPTPVLAFAIRYLAADAGVMVTASHNPAQDNGYKVYLGDGTQLSSPIDAQIAAHISSVARVDELPRSDNYVLLGTDIPSAYIDAICETITPIDTDIPIAYTAMHGVGAKTFLTAATRCGFTNIQQVPTQAEPNPNFPTLPFPNPEEAGALDLLLSLAEQIKAPIAIAHDPDADRLSISVRTARSGGYRTLSGDELGIVLAHALLERGIRGVFVNTIVSSPMLGVLAADYGQPWKQTLTGFKWIGKVDGLAYGYEEALGYCVRPDLFGDKDGISAALLFLSYATELHMKGRSVLDELDGLAEKHGLYASQQLSIRTATSARARELVRQVSNKPPSVLAGSPVTNVQDLADARADLPSTTGFMWQLDNGATIICRPSGTEAKIKCYFHVHVPVESSSTAASKHAEQLLGRLRFALEELYAGAL